MKKRFLTISCACALSLSAGCSLGPSHYKVNLFSPKHLEFPEIKSQIIQKEISRTDYHHLYKKHKFMVVSGQLENTEIQYPFILDTGASRSVFIQQYHALEHNLPLYELSDNSPESTVLAGQGTLSRFHIAGIDFIDWPSFYLKQPKSHLNSLSSSANEAIILGLDVLRRFRYIQFDNAGKHVTFSKNDAFHPQSKNEWIGYPIYLEEDFGGNVFLFVTMEIQGQTMNLQLDTGSGNGLVISHRLWDRISGSFRKSKIKRSRLLFPYIGHLSCQTTTVDKLSLGNQTIKKAAIAILPDNNPALNGCEGMLGMGYLDNMNIVLDFWNEMLWIHPAT